MRNQRNLRNVGILAHVDAGKTTTTEQMLYLSGKIRSLGRVDTGTAQTDWLDVERTRGISVMASTVSFPWKDCTINLIDTPGHVDFSSEVERSLRVLDGAILVISAVEGVQAHTESLWHALQAMRIPTLIFINKMDRIGADASKVLAEIHEVLIPSAVPIQVPLGEASDFFGMQSLFMDIDDINMVEEQKRVRINRDLIIEKIAEKDEWILEKYINGESLSSEVLEQRLISFTRTADIFPVLYGAASKGVGITELLNAVVRYLPEPSGSDDQHLSGVVFKLERDKIMGRIAHVRLYGGKIQNRDMVFNATQNKSEKVTQIRKIHVHHQEDIGVVSAGDIAAICGFNDVRIGDILGDPSAVPKEHQLTTPLLTVQVHAVDSKDYPALVSALQELADEDPLLDLQWLQDERELHIKVIGPIQLEILTSILQSRFGLDAVFDRPSVIYKETPVKEGEGYIAYTMPKPCWAILRFHIEPGERDSGLIYSSTVRTEDLLQRYQNEVERRVPEALQQGLYGWAVTNLKVTLIEGEHHVFHTHPLDFAVATPMGIMDGLAQTGTKLLEPMLHFRISVPEEIGGRVLSDLSQMRASFDNPSVHGGRFTVEGRVPLATSMHYSVQLSSLSGGLGTMTTRFAGYQECPPDVQAERKRRGVNPLDRSKYILSTRSALARE